MEEPNFEGFKEYLQAKRSNKPFCTKCRNTGIHDQGFNKVSRDQREQLWLKGHPSYSSCSCSAGDKLRAAAVVRREELERQSRERQEAAKRIAEEERDKAEREQFEARKEEPFVHALLLAGICPYTAMEQGGP